MRKYSGMRVSISKFSALVRFRVQSTENPVFGLHENNERKLNAHNFFFGNRLWCLKFREEKTLLVSFDTLKYLVPKRFMDFLVWIFKLCYRNNFNSFSFGCTCTETVSNRKTSFQVESSNSCILSTDVSVFLHYLISMRVSKTNIQK